jgi:hypothetical protein
VKESNGRRKKEASMDGWAKERTDLTMLDMGGFLSARSWYGKLHFISHPCRFPVANEESCVAPSTGSAFPGFLWFLTKFEL